LNGYVAGGRGTGFPRSNIIQRFPFTSPFTNATDIGDLSEDRRALSEGNSSDTDGFSATGETFRPFPVGAYLSTRVDRFPFSSPFTTATTVGNLNTARAFTASQSSSSNGYTSGGKVSDIGSPLVVTSQIERFPFSSPFVNATDVGDLTVAAGYQFGNESSTDGYTSGGVLPTTIFVQSVSRFPFSSPFTTATTVSPSSAINPGRQSASTSSSPTDGYFIAGFTPVTPQRDEAYRFPFSAPFTTIFGVGRLGNPTGDYLSGMRSDNHGYAVGAVGAANLVSRYPFSFPFPVGATDIGNLSPNVNEGSGHQG
jgi:hypothetical protein